MEKKVVIAGWGQVTQGREQKEKILDPLGLMTKAAYRAAQSAGDANILKKIDGIMAVRVLSTFYSGTADLLSRKIGASSRYKLVSRIGGNSPQSLVNKAAGMIARGELDTVLIAGAEAYYPRSKEDIWEGNALFKGLVGEHERDDMIGSSELEDRHGISLPVQGFPLFEVALWAESGLGLSPYLEKIGDMWSRFSQVAANHQNAWTKAPLSAAEITTPTRTNRMIAFPYTKFMNSLISVDLGAAIILMSEEKAGTLKSKGKNPVFFLSGAYVEDRQRFLIQRTSFTASPPLGIAAENALRRSHLSLDDVDCFDLYSCFPCSVTIARRTLGIKDHNRPLTLTGGLGFFGGPGNNYCLHAIATLAKSISEGRYKTGMITGIGWFMHKHAVGIYSSVPRETGLRSHDLADEKDPVVGNEPVKQIEEASGKGFIETYTVIYSRSGRPEKAVIYGMTEKGYRFVAQTPERSEIFKALATENHVGKAVRLSHDSRKRLNVAEVL
jgi:acetyl-CoA C-acetyltransferase